LQALQGAYALEIPNGPEGSRKLATGCCGVQSYLEKLPLYVAREHGPRRVTVVLSDWDIGGDIRASSGLSEEILRGGLKDGSVFGKVFKSGKNSGAVVVGDTFEGRCRQYKSNSMVAWHSGKSLKVAIAFSDMDGGFTEGDVNEYFRIADAVCNDVEWLQLQEAILIKLASKIPDSGYTGLHSNDTHRYAVALGKEMKLTPGGIATLGLSALLHDLGKLFVPESILNKQGPLSEEEFDIVRTHPAHGMKIIKEMGLDCELAAIGEHHERWDGTGYPRQKSKYQISTHGCILSACDAASAMKNKRYGRQKNAAEAAKELSLCADSQFRRDIAHSLAYLLVDGLYSSN
jgi:hypothetical protein